VPSYILRSLKKFQQLANRCEFKSATTRQHVEKFRSLAKNWAGGVGQVFRSNRHDGTVCVCPFAIDPLDLRDDGDYFPIPVNSSNHDLNVAPWVSFVPPGAVFPIEAQLDNSRATARIRGLSLGIVDQHLLHRSWNSFHSTVSSTLQTGRLPEVI